MPASTASELPQAYALPGVHAAAYRLLADLPRGQLIDLAAGQGALSYWAREQGFDVTALEIGREHFRAAGVPCLAADLNEPIPLADASADVVVALEIVEHLENQYQFLREIARVLRPGGHAIVSTPNEHNFQNRWNYFVTGFYGDSRHVILEDDPELPMRHINMATPAMLELMWRRAGLELVDITASQLRPTAFLWAPLVYPLQWLKFKLKLAKIKDRHERAVSERVYRLLNDPRLVLGRVIAYKLRKPAVGGASAARRAA